MDVVDTEVLVLGQGIAGLLATAVARTAGLTTTVVERAPLNRRAGVPHSSQLHNLLGRGRLELERILPGLTEELPLFDGVRADVSRETRVFDAGRRAVERELGRELWSIPRMRLEDAIRGRQETSPDVLIEGRAVDLIWEGGGCVGAMIETAGGQRSLRAGLVVDAMGASSPVPSRLLGFEHTVPRIVVDVDQWYVSAVVRPAEPRLGFVMVFPSGDGTRGGLASPRSDGDYVVSLNGIATVDRPPSTPTEFREFALSLPDPGIADVLDGAHIGRSTLFRRPRAVWNRYDLAPVPGLVALGDASSAPNPLLGQGISGTAWEARNLGESIVSSSRAEGFPLSAGRVRSAVWDLMTLYSPVRTDVPSSADWQQISDYVEREPAAHRALVDVLHLLAPVSGLAHLARSELPPATDTAPWN